MLSAGTRLGAYEIVALIGAGGMGEVYRATDTRLHRSVAIKVSSQLFADRFRAEARVIASINHPNICTLHDVGPDFLVMELVEGPTLADRIAQGPIPLDEVMAIAEQIQLALAAAHDRGIVHRDLKPANIKLTAKGSVKVLDFGLAKSADLSNPNPDLSPTMILPVTQTGVIVGTAAYMAPEQARGKEVDKRADIWAFGVVLYEMITGRKPFGGDTMTDTLAAVIERDPSFDDVPARVRPLLRACLQKDPRWRLHDISDAKLLLEVAATTASPSSQPGGMGAALGTRATWALLAAAVVVIAGLSVVAIKHVRETSQTAELPVTFTISAPALAQGATFALAVSPDNRKVAYIAQTSDGIRHIFVRAMDTLEARMLPGTENGSSPFWSPDSRFVGFGEGPRLKKVDATGAAPPVLLCEVSGNVGIGSWNRDDTIVFGSRGGKGGLRKVSAKGGTSTPVTEVPPDENFHSFPAFLPDQRHFVYLRQSTDAEKRGIYVGTLDVAADKQSTTRLVASQFGAVAVPSTDGRHARVLFVSDDRVMAQDLDLDRLILTGEPIPVATDVGTAGSGGHFAASADVLTYRTTGTSSGRQLTWYDRKGTVLSTVATQGQFGELSLSPDRTRLAVYDAQNGSDVSVVDLRRGGGGTRLTFNRAGARSPVWSPNGDAVIYASADGLYRKSANGAGDPQRLLAGTDLTAQDWSRDGRYLLYASETAQTGSDLWVLPLEGAPTPSKAIVTPFAEAQARFSPDGRWIVYVSGENGRPDVFVVPFTPPGASAPAASGRWMVSDASGWQPHWSSDGKEILYLAADGRLMSATLTFTGDAVQASVPKVLFQTSILNLPVSLAKMALWDVSRDGQKILINSILGGPAATAPITVVEHWQELLKTTD